MAGDCHGFLFGRNSPDRRAAGILHGDGQNPVRETKLMLRSILPAAAFFGAAILAGCAQTGDKTPAATTELAADAGPYRPFSADSPWNTNIPSDAKIDPNSDVLMADFAEMNPLHINIAEWSVAVYQVDAKTAPKQYVQALYPNQYGRGFGPRQRIPIPNGAAPGGPELGTGYLVLEDRKAGTAWEMRQAGQNKDGGLEAILTAAPASTHPGWWPKAR